MTLHHTAPSARGLPRGLRIAALAGAIVAALGGCDGKDEASISALLQHIERGSAPSDDFDNVRRFIRAHSIHRNNEELKAIRENRGFAREVLKHVNGERKEPVPMLCGARAWLQHDLLEAMGYDARVVNIFDAESKNSHTFAEVLNAATKRWETTDSDYNIFWREAGGEARVAITEYAPQRVDEIEPCNDDGCGWQVAKKARRLPPLFDRVEINE